MNKDNDTMERKVYTAQEMRKMATMLEEERRECAICMYDEYDDAWRPLWMKPNPVVLALRQAADAADAIEREEKRKKKYETSIRYAGRGRYATFIREVGEWKKVRDGE